jgi:hypothetical protein
MSATQRVIAVSWSIAALGGIGQAERGEETARRKPAGNKRGREGAWREKVSGAGCAPWASDGAEKGNVNAAHPASMRRVTVMGDLFIIFLNRIALF